MPALVAGIHEHLAVAMDGRDEPGHDEWVLRAASAALFVCAVVFNTGIRHDGAEG
jgi:hypothetical protein